jgi:uncharacterized protein YutE (UPF0331/DUF86 family)
MRGDTAFITSEFQRLDGALAMLNKLAPLDLRQDLIARSAAERQLQIAIEICLDVARHIIAESGLPRPSTASDAFAILAEMGILPEDFLLTAQRMARFRNHLVHLYWDVEVGDCGRYCAQPPGRLCNF